MCLTNFGLVTLPYRNTPSCPNEAIHGLIKYNPMQQLNPCKKSTLNRARLFLRPRSLAVAVASLGS
jgi:hypothetical protein